jgi:hypothetical protein
MSNPLSVRRIQVQEIDEQGNPVDAPTFGIVASDDSETVFMDIYESREELEAAIQRAPSILAVIDPDEEKFPDPDHKKIGKNNFYGKDWYN